ncbi:hypothetical protein [Caulobacter sp. S45]|nr:hypothetical protein [Caulobacter sp. S45]
MATSPCISMLCSTPAGSQIAFVAGASQTMARVATCMTPEQAKTG